MALVAFDFETVATDDPLELLGREADVASEVRGLAEQRRSGDLAGPDCLRQQVALLDGLPESRMRSAFADCRLREGVGETIGDLRRSRTSVALVTETLERCVEETLERAEVAVDHLAANRLVLENGALSGDVDGPLLEDGPDEVLGAIATSEDLAVADTVAVGSGLPALPMLQAAGTAIGYDPPPAVQQYCDVVVTSMDRLRLYLAQHGMIDATVGP